MSNKHLILVVAVVLFSSMFFVHMIPVVPEPKFCLTLPCPQYITISDYLSKMMEPRITIPDCNLYPC